MTIDDALLAALADGPQAGDALIRHLGRLGLPGVSARTVTESLGRLRDSGRVYEREGKWWLTVNAPKQGRLF